MSFLPEAAQSYRRDTDIAIPELSFMPKSLTLLEQALYSNQVRVSETIERWIGKEMLEWQKKVIDYYFRPDGIVKNGEVEMRSDFDCTMIDVAWSEEYGR